MIDYVPRESTGKLQQQETTQHTHSRRKNDQLVSWSLIKSLLKLFKSKWKKIKRFISRFQFRDEVVVRRAKLHHWRDCTCHIPNVYFFCGKITEFHLLLNTKKILENTLKNYLKKFLQDRFFFAKWFLSHTLLDILHCFFSSENREHATQICDRETFFFRSRRQQSKFIYFLFISEGVKNRFFMAH